MSERWSDKFSHKERRENKDEKSFLPFNFANLAKFGNLVMPFSALNKVFIVSTIAISS